jgi:hypothetical protein
MTSKTQITKIASRDGVDARVVERDYVLAHVVALISSHDTSLDGRSASQPAKPAPRGPADRSGAGRTLQIAEAHDGTLSLRNRKQGHGAEAVITLPAPPLAASQAAG